MMINNISFTFYDLMPTSLKCFSSIFDSGFNAIKVINENLKHISIFDSIRKPALIETYIRPENKLCHIWKWKMNAYLVLTDRYLIKIIILHISDNLINLANC